MTKKSTIAQAFKAENKYKGYVFLRSVPVTTKTAFKAACAKRNRSMRDVLVILMRRFAHAVEYDEASIDVRKLPHGIEERHRVMPPHMNDNRAEDENI